MCTLQLDGLSLWFVTMAYLSLTVAVDGTMRARLLAVAFDFFPSALIACASHPAPLLQMRRGLDAIWLAGGARRCLCVLYLESNIVVAGLYLTESVVVFFGRCAIHGGCYCCSMTAPGQAKMRRKDRMMSYRLRCGGRRDRSVGCARRFVLVGIRRLAEW